MARELITSWADYQTAIDRLLAIATHHICVYDEDLATLKLDSRPRLEHIKRLLDAKHGDILRMAVRNASPLRHQHPLLQQLLTTYGHLCCSAGNAQPDRPPARQHDHCRWQARPDPF